MKQGGWNVDNAPAIYRAHSMVCQTPPSFWGYQSGPTVGHVEATFSGSGVAQLNFGNCHSMGLTKVYLNDQEIGSALPNEIQKNITFDYKKGDILKLTEESMGIIKISSLTLSNC